MRAGLGAQAGASVLAAVQGSQCPEPEALPAPTPVGGAEPVSHSNRWQQNLPWLRQLCRTPLFLPLRARPSRSSQRSVLPLPAPYALGSGSALAEAARRRCLARAERREKASCQLGSLRRGSAVGKALKEGGLGQSSAKGRGRPVWAVLKDAGTGAALFLGSGKPHVVKPCEMTGRCCHAVLDRLKLIMELDLPSVLTSCLSYLLLPGRNGRSW